MAPLSLRLSVLTSHADLYNVSLSMSGLGLRLELGSGLELSLGLGLRLVLGLGKREKDW